MSQGKLSAISFQQEAWDDNIPASKELEGRSEEGGTMKTKEIFKLLEETEDISKRKPRRGMTIKFIKTFTRGMSQLNAAINRDKGQLHRKRTQ